MTHRVVIIGSGFGGLFAARALKHVEVKITMISKTAQHLFQPLLYQVATGILSEGEIAPSTREILRRQHNVTVNLGLVERIDTAARKVHWRYHGREATVEYDTLIVAAGAGQSYFGNDHFSRYAPGMKTIDDALELRARILGAFELAETEPKGSDVSKYLTFAVVGAGPTGVEMAGQIRELASETLVGEFRNIDPRKARVVLIEGGTRVLPSFGDRLSLVAKHSLEKRDIEIWLQSMVTNVDDSGIEIRKSDGTTHWLNSVCKVWAAGVQGSPLGKQLAEQSEAKLDRSGRLQVNPDLSLPGHPEIYVIGDLMAVPGVPGVAQGAIQSARYVAKRITNLVRGKPELGPFRYRDKGSMATISRFSAVASVGRLRFTGFIAWMMWLVLHLLYIAGFKQRLTTLLHWMISFISRGRSERVMTNQQLVGRLALEELGVRASGRLLKGEQSNSDQNTG